MFDGIAKAGAITAPLNYRLSREDYETMINQNNPTALIFGSEFTNDIEEIRPNLPDSLEYYIILDEEGPDWAIKYPDLMEESSSSKPDVAVNEDNGYYLNYTSGTTGLPKASIISHKNHFMCTLQFIVDTQFREDDVMGIEFGQYGRIAIAQTAMGILKGAKSVIMEFEPEKFMELVEKEKITYTHLAPTMMNMILKNVNLEKYDSSSLRAIYSIGSALPSNAFDRMTEQFGTVIGEYYGTTETCPITTVRPEAKIDKPESCGRPVLFVEAKVVNEDGKEVSAGKRGEIIAKGPAFNANYIYNSPKTAEVMRNGWFHTRNIGYIDEDGFFYVEGRIGDMIVSGAENIYPGEIEDVIQSHPDVLENAVIGVPHSKWGQAVLAIVVTKSEAELNEDGVIAFTKERLANFKCPKYVRFQEEIPRNPTGKVLRNELFEKYKDIAE